MTSMKKIEKMELDPPLKDQSKIESGVRIQGGGGLRKKKSETLLP